MENHKSIAQHKEDDVYEESKPYFSNFVSDDMHFPKLIAEIGDVRRFHSGKALVAHAGIDAPPYQFGQFVGTERKISKRGSASLRKIGYEVMRCLKTHKAPEDAAVYEFIIKLEK